jgi:hypothetical protein
MPTTEEFRRHLHDVMIETMLGLREELNQHQRELVFQAQQTLNAAAVPIAYSKAAIHAFRIRIEAVTDRFMDAIEKCGVEVDDAVEKEVLSSIGSLTSAKHPLSFPPGVKRQPNIAAVQRAHTMELDRSGSLLYRQAANRLREAKIKAKQRPKGSGAFMSQSKPFTIGSVIHSLAELKVLATPEQDMLLLRRLVFIYPHMASTGGLHKGNLLLPGDSYGLGTGLPDNENMPIRQYMLGAPWTRLVNAGFITDPAGSGFFAPTDEGKAAVALAAEGKLTPSGKPGSTDVPTAFISYSWDGPEHKEWVLRLAERLRGNGVNVILDQWNLPLGGDRTYFMENSVCTSDFVLLICTPNYAQKSNTRTGGVGYEATILTGQLAQQITQNKFIPVLRSAEWDDTAIPIWLQTKIGVDLRDDPINEEQYQLLLTTLHNEQVKAPPIGPKPSFLPPARLQSEGIMENAVSAALAPVGADTITKTAASTSSRPKPSPEAYAFYEKKGSGARMQVYVRPADGSPDRYSLETSTGDLQEGMLKEISLLYLTKDYELKSEGYSRMQSFNGTSGQRFNLPQ